MTKIRVLHVAGQLEIGCSEKTLQIFCKYLDKSRFEVFACGRLRGGVRVKELEGLGIPVFVRPPDFNTLVQELKIDICHVHRSGHYEPGSLPEKQGGWPRIVETNVFNYFDPVENELIDYHLFVSEFSRNRYAHQHGEDSQFWYGVLYNPVDFEEFSGVAKTFTHTIGRCSRPDDAKWHIVCVNCLPRVFRKVPQTRCLVQGATDQVRARLARLGVTERVDVWELSLQVRDFYREVDVFIHGARVGETFGCGIAEAMANRIPVVTLSTPGRKKANAQTELVEHNTTGFVCRFSWQYADAVIELLKNHELRERFAIRSYEKARAQFDASMLTRKLERIYFDLMDSRS
ncbi:MAG: glycosyltransferase family 4 protein [Acidobacteriota bacterium]